MCTYKYTHTHTHTRVHTNAHTHTHTCAYKCTHTRACVHVHTHTPHTHMYTHTCTHSTLLSFEHFLYTKMGPLSNANLCYQLWRSVAGYRRLPMSRKPLKDRAAIKIYRVFLFEDSRRRVRLPERAMRGIDLAKQICRPTTPTLLALQEASAEVFEPVIRMFLGNGEWEHQVVAPLPPFERGMSKKLSRSISSSRVGGQ